MEEPQYEQTWQSIRPEDFRVSSSSRGLGVWTILALIFSVGLHIVLFYMFNVWRLDFNINSAEDRKVEVKERFQIDRELLEAGAVVQEVPDLAEVAAPDLGAIDTNLDLLEIQEQLPEKEVILTPDVADAQNFVAELGEPTRSMAGAALENLLDVGGAASAETLEADMSRLKKKMAERGAVSDNQLLLDATDLEDIDVEEGPDDILENLAKGEGVGSGIGDGVEGFNSLDDLLARTGALPKNLDPVLMPTDLVFGYNEVEVKESARFSMMKLGLLIQKNPTARFIIEGHTDSIGGDEYNQILSEQRAAAVKRWLERSLRIDGSRIETKGYGETRHLAPADGTKEEQAINRRVEIVIKPE